MEEANKDYEAFLSALGLRESSGRYDVENPWGYLGKYQMGEAALIDAGYYLQDGTAKNDWKGIWTGKDGVWSKEDFLSSPWAQENAIRISMAKLWIYIQALGLDAYVGKGISGIQITPSGLLASAHLLGVGNLRSFLLGEPGRFQDALGTDIKEYLGRFTGYDIPFTLKA